VWVFAGGGLLQRVDPARDQVVHTSRSVLRGSTAAGSPSAPARCGSATLPPAPCSGSTPRADRKLGVRPGGASSEFLCSSHVTARSLPPHRGTPIPGGRVGGGPRRTPTYPLIALVIVLVVLGTALPPAAGDRPPNGRITFQAGSWAGRLSLTSGGRPGRNCMACKGSGRCHPQSQIPRLGAWGRVRLPNNPHPPGPTVSFPQLS
jgi:hypothetical protein